MRVDSILDFAGEFEDWCEQNGGEFESSMADKRMICRDSKGQVEFGQDRNLGVHMYGVLGGGPVKNIEDVEFRGDSMVTRASYYGKTLIEWNEDGMDEFLHPEHHHPDIHIEEFPTKEF